MYSITDINGNKQDVSLAELNQLKKDILWTYDEHYHSMDNVMIPNDSFVLGYQKYLFLDKDEYFDDRDFYINGSLVILLAICIEYIDTMSGDPETLKRIGIGNVQEAMIKFTPSSELQAQLKVKILVGLEIASSMTEKDILNKAEEYYHEQMPSFYNNIMSITDAVIEEYLVYKYSVSP